VRRKKKEEKLLTGKHGHPEKPEGLKKLGFERLTRSRRIRKMKGKRGVESARLTAEKKRLKRVKEYQTGELGEVEFDNEVENKKEVVL